MGQKYAGLNALLDADPRARRYFDGLPGYVQEHISSRGDSVNSFDSLRDYAENLLRGDD